MKHARVSSMPIRFGPLVLVLGIFALAWSILLFAHPEVAAVRMVSALGWAMPVIGIALLCGALAIFGREVLATPGGSSGQELASARTAVLLFIISEVMLFASLFAAYFYFAAGYTWPPTGLEKPDTWGTPLLGTVLLLLSGGAAVTAHHLFLRGCAAACAAALAAAIALGVVFLVAQAFEFAHSSFSFQDGAYPSVFFLATGLHGTHVLVGVVLLTIALMRLRAGRFSRESHFGLEAPIWYWHFVDAVWIVLFAVFYTAFA